MGHIVLMRRILTILIIVLATWAPFKASASEGGMSIIRDTEIEFALRAWSTPIWRAAGLNPDAIKVVLVDSPDLNAFVAGGDNIFVFTGLIAAAKNPGELIGVIAHETGHIAGGHLIQGREALKRASYETMLATILGIGAAAAGGGDAGRAIMMGGRGAAMSGFLAHSRVQESSADQAALKFMEAAHDNPKGLESLLNTLKSQELLPQSQQSGYLRTHPLTGDRIEAMKIGVAKSQYLDTAYAPEMIEQFERIKAKLAGFTSPERVEWMYSDKDTSTPALYARAIAAYRRSEKDTALTLINKLLEREPKDPWFHEIKGQMLRDFGQIDEAVESYRRAITLSPDAALVRIDLAQVLIEMPGNHYTEAEKNLEAALVKEPKSTQIQHLFATIYGRAGDEPRARYHLAEEAALKGDTKEAQKLLEGALAGLKPSNPDFRRANDLKLYLDSQPKKDDRDER